MFLFRDIMGSAVVVNEDSQNLPRLKIIGPYEQELEVRLDTAGVDGLIAALTPFASIPDEPKTPTP